MKEKMFDYSLRLEDVVREVNGYDKDTADAFKRLLHTNEVVNLISEKAPVESDLDENTNLDYDDLFIDFNVYHDLMRSLRLLALAGKTARDLFKEESEFLFGCPIKYRPFSEEDIYEICYELEYISIEYTRYYYAWLVFGAFGEAEMAVMIDPEKGTVHPVPFVPLRSKYKTFGSTSERRYLSFMERGVLIDKIFYHIYVPKDFEMEPNIEETDESKNVLENNEVEEEVDLWDQDDEEDEEENIRDEEEEEEEIWDEEDEEEEEDMDDECWDDTDDEEKIDPKDQEKMRQFCESMRDIEVLSVTDLHGNDISGNETSMFPNIYANLKGFVGKNDKIAIGERMYIFHPKPTLNPYCPNVRIHTSTVMFHSEELVSVNEVKHIVRTLNSIYTFIEYKNN